MKHFSVRATPHSLLFRTWPEGLELWRRLLRAAPRPVALCVMPDHVHVLHRRDVATPLLAALRGYALWRNARRGERGPVWRPLGEPTEPNGVLKQWRDEKYVHKNPCRARLTDAPLAWPLSTYREAVGLSLGGVRGADSEPLRYHEQTCRDDFVTFRELPVGQGHPVSPPQVAEAVSSLLRVPMSDLRRRGRPRALFLKAARSLSDAGTDELAAWAHITRRQVQRVAGRFDPEVALVNRVVGDPRFHGLHDGQLMTEPSWQRYMRARRLGG